MSYADLLIAAIVSVRGRITVITFVHRAYVVPYRIRCCACAVVSKESASAHAPCAVATKISYVTARAATVRSTVFRTNYYPFIFFTSGREDVRAGEEPRYEGNSKINIRLAV
jgi:hypothetical protein